MGIKRYKPTKDNTITNAYKSALLETKRGTGSNMGMADVVEVFSIYGQGSGSSGLSQELSRALIEFPISTVITDRTAGTIPASGSVSFYLRMYNAKHAFTLPRDFALTVQPVSSSWQEGVGLDMEEYTDRTYDGAGSNWINRGGPPVAASTNIVITNYNALASGVVATLTPRLGTAITFTEGTDWTAETTNATTATNLATAIDANSNYAATAVSHSGTPSVPESSASVTVTVAGPSSGGSFGNSDLLQLTTDGNWSSSSYSNGSGFGRWTSRGGDYRPTINGAGALPPSASFPEGYEDIELDISEIVENWVKGTSGGGYPNYGLSVHLTGSQEAYFSSSTGTNTSIGLLHNVTGATTSYYTKKFFARSSEFFFKRPRLEARWDSRVKDDRGNFYFSSSLATAADNLNTLYLYNYSPRTGKLTNLPNTVAGGPILVSIYSGSTVPTGSKLALPAGGGVVAAGHFNVTGGWYKTGIYSASLSATGSLTTLFDVWHTGAANATEFFTGSITPKSVIAYDNAPSDQHATSISNLKPKYIRSETARMRLFVRDRNWSPTIYSVATSTITNKTIPSASYRIYRVADELNVVPYGTGSTKHTYLSHDVSGNYFDFDMSMLQGGYSYGLKFVYYNDSIKDWVEQPEEFRFRVEEG